MTVVEILAAIGVICVLATGCCAAIVAIQALAERLLGDERELHDASLQWPLSTQLHVVPRDELAERRESRRGPGAAA